jgi:hypothetical protein
MPTPPSIETEVQIPALRIGAAFTLGIYKTREFARPYLTVMNCGLLGALQTTFPFSS